MNVIVNLKEMKRGFNRIVAIFLILVLGLESIVLPVSSSSTFKNQQTSPWDLTRLLLERWSSRGCGFSDKAFFGNPISIQFLGSLQTKNRTLVSHGSS